MKKKWDIRNIWNNSFKRKAKVYTAGLLTVALAAGALHDYGGGQVQGSTLPGIDKIVTDYTESQEFFHILEVVGDMQEANIGYLIGGEEPIANGKKLSEMPSAYERSWAMNESGWQLNNLDDYKALLDFSKYEEVPEGTQGTRPVLVRGMYVPGGSSYMYTEATFNVVLDDGSNAEGKQRYGRLVTIGEMKENILPNEKRVGLTLVPTGEKQEQNVTIIGEQPGAKGKNGQLFCLNKSEQLSHVAWSENLFDSSLYSGQTVYRKNSDGSFTYYGTIVGADSVSSDVEILTDEDVENNAAIGATPNPGPTPAPGTTPNPETTPAPGTTPNPGDTPTPENTPNAGDSTQPPAQGDGTTQPDVSGNDRSADDLSENGGGASEALSVASVSVAFTSMASASMVSVSTASTSMASISLDSTGEDAADENAAALSSVEGADAISENVNNGDGSVENAGSAGGSGSEANPPAQVENPDAATPESTPEAASPAPDAASPAPAASSAPDAANSTPAASSAPDAANSTPDAAGSTPDVANPTPDAGSPTLPEASPAPDAANPTPEASPAPDAAVMPIVDIPVNTGTPVQRIDILYILHADGSQADKWISSVDSIYGSHRIKDSGGNYIEDELYIAEFKEGEGTPSYAVTGVMVCDNGNFLMTNSYRHEENGMYVINEKSIVAYKVGENQFCYLDENGEVRTCNPNDPSASGVAGMLPDTYDFIGDYGENIEETVYYRGGITNKELFKTNVLNLSADNIDDLKIEVSTVTVAELENLVKDGAYCGITLDNVNFIYLSGGTVGDDATALRLARMVLGVDNNNQAKMLSRVPVVMSYSFYQANQALGNLLLQADKEDVVLAFAGSGNIAAASAGGFNVSGHQYLAGNVYMFDDSSRLHAYAASDFNTRIEAGDIFKAVLDEIVNENAILKQGGVTQLIEEVVSKASITRYIINWTRRRTSKSSLTVLDLEPCYDFDGENALTADMVKTYMNQPGYIGDINIVQMPSAEFIGKIEDLNERYDMIYVGSRTGKMNRASNGTTLYNDSSMNGLVYTHVGDSYSYDKESSSNNDKIRLKDASLQEEKGSQLNVYRGPGNDMNSTREEEFEQYIEAGYPVVFAENLLRNIDTDVRANTITVDCNSYFYRLITFALSRGADGEYLYWGKNVFADSQLMGTDGNRERQDSFYNSVNRQKPKINWVADLGEEYMPVEYDEDMDTDSRFLRASGGNYFLQYIFYLENDGSVSVYGNTYDCKLYIDNNADGRFAGSAYSENGTNDASEELKGLTAYRRSGNAWEPVSQVERDGVLRYELTIGETYKIVRRVPDDYQGMLPWKLVFYDNSDKLVRTSRIGYTAINREEKVQIRVLQLMSDYEPNSKSGKTNWNLQADGDVQELLKEVPGFSVSITSMKTSDFIKQNVRPGGGISQNANSVQKEKYYQQCYNNAYAALGNYDMVILGFGDNYRFGPTDSQALGDDYSGEPGSATIDKSQTAQYSNEATAEAIRDYIEDGRSVLFTHDSSSYINSQEAKNQSWYWGYEFNKILRASVGLDRYGALRSYYRQKSEDASLSSDARERYRRYLVVLEDEDEYQYDTMTQPGDSGASLLPHKEGLTKYTVVRFMTRHMQSLLDNGGSRSQIDGEGAFYFPVENQLMFRALYKGGGASKAMFGTYEDCGKLPGATLTATMVNEGQITNYPFKISDDELRTLEVANTHYQWMQPNMELDRDHDGKNDIVVWYCLSDLSGESREVKERNDGYADNIYSVCPNDVVNNYYIYSMGNVTYSGAGHTSPSNSAEKKLFVNTMVAAYSAGVKSPSVTFQNDSGDAIDAVYMMYDNVNHIVLNGQENLEVKFQPVDYNILSGVVGIRVEFFKEVEENTPGAMQVDGIAGYVVPLDSGRIGVSSPTGQIEATPLDGGNSMDGYFKTDFYDVPSDGVYTLTISRDLLGIFVENGGGNAYLKDSANAGTVYVRATTIYDRGSRRTESSARALSISVAELFDLK